MPDSSYAFMNYLKNVLFLAFIHTVLNTGNWDKMAGKLGSIQTENKAVLKRD